MDSPATSHYQSWFVRSIAIFSIVFMLWFVVTEANGLWHLARFLSDALYSTPNLIIELFNYYLKIPSWQVAPSLLLGGFLGGLLTSRVYANNQKSFREQLSSLDVIVGPIFPVLLLILGIETKLALVAGIVVSFGIVWLRPDSKKELFEAFATDRSKFVGIGLVGGVLGGIVGSQLLLYPTRHCTFEPETTGSEYRIGIVLTVLGIVILLLPLWSILNQRTQSNRQSTAGQFRGYGVPLAFLLPTMLILLIFLYYPTVEIISKSLTQSNARLPGRSVFVCLQNYTGLAGDATYINSLLATLFITIAIVILALSLSLAIALLASQKVRGAYIYRTLLIWPYALSPVVAGAIFFTMFQQDSGLINSALEILIGRQLRWFTSATPARIMIVMASVWNILGFNILFYIAGLQTIPTDLLESAAIDGANRFRRFYHITLPLLTPFTFFLLITNVTYSFYGIFGVVDVLTQGGPRLGEGGASGATEVLIYRLYNGSSQAGSAAAQALVLFVMIAAITVMQFGMIERRVSYTD